MDGIMRGIVESRRKMYSPKKDNMHSMREKASQGDIYRKLKDVETTLMTVSWRLQQHDCEMLNKQKAIDDLQVKVYLLQNICVSLYQEKEELTKNVIQLSNELKSMARRECLIHSDKIASIWKPSD